MLQTQADQFSVRQYLTSQYVYPPKCQFRNRQKKLKINCRSGFTYNMIEFLETLN